MNENEMGYEGEDFGAEDELTEEIVEEPEDDSESLDEIMNEDEEQQEEPQGTSGRREPGYVQGRINKAVEKAVAEVRAQMEADFEARMAPYREQMMEAQAKELVASGKVKDLETAKELVRYRQGQPQPERREQPRDDQGRYEAEPERDPVIQERISMLQHQADRLKGRGIDVIETFRTNEKVKMKVVSGEWDFEDVADYMTSRQKRTPAPMRSPNGASGANKTAIENMSDEQFDRLVRSVQGGKRYSQR